MPNALLAIGGEFIGLEMSEALYAAGVKTTIILRSTANTNRWDRALSSMMLEDLQAHGVDFVGNAAAQAIEEGTNAPLRVKTDKGI